MPCTNPSDDGDTRGAWVHGRVAWLAVGRCRGRPRTGLVHLIVTGTPSQAAAMQQLLGQQCNPACAVRLGYKLSSVLWTAVAGRSASLQGGFILATPP
jgi:hypothetical protein